MYLILSASKDAYITNKIIDSKFRAVDSSTGKAGTLDLFKLYNESIIPGESNPVEISRVLIKFDTSLLSSLTASTLDINNPEFKCALKMYDVKGTQSVPRNFNLLALPLSQSFDEGDGRDVGSFSDIDVANFMTASYSAGTTYPWFLSGAAKIGALGSADIDVIGSGSLGAGIIQLGASQNFFLGTEDLSIDVTKIVSATLSGQLPDHGFRVSFITAEETDNKTRFVKRFGSRHSKNLYLRPSLHISFDDSIHDNHSSFVFDVTGSIFLSNYHRSALSNILSGSSLTPLQGDNCMRVRIGTGLYTKTLSASTYTSSTTGAGIPGLYFTSFAIPYSDESIVIGSSSIADFAYSSGSLTFTETWESNDGTVQFYEGSIEIKSPDRSALSYIPRNPNIKTVNILSDYNSSDIVRIRLFGIDTQNIQNRTAKTYKSIKSEIFEKVYYRVVDTDLSREVIPFDTISDGTRCSTDSDGMFFDFRMSSLAPGRVYHFEFFIVDREIKVKIPHKSPTFRVNIV